ncbi:Six-hairpin glycosidase-like protein [Talaromyces proteolyticus]|uniref:Six-hairpin glycosidase-like protein n=1 Tax=Talaromyces proteolyticus TaxID=1131652 RepID=A0AAD4KGL1_9EURO|nr:Six-hairpin glycosidase-like protein [Talaromyces proteolyticus]KAH8691376.1 Six-hairpin glycosidase-like protein [Talaromyces proteolyticus]
MILFYFLFYAETILAQQPPQPEDVNVPGTNFLDHNSPISSYFGQEFLKENIPFIDIPDANIQEIYYYRWSTLAGHLRYITPGTGYILTEFLQPVGYAEAYNTIDAAAGHQIDEARWLRGSFYAGDYIQVYTRGPGNTTQYTNWITDAAYRRAQVNGDVEFLTSQLDGFLRMWDEWDFVFDEDAGLYYYTPLYDAQEYSLPDYVDAAETNDTAIQFQGPDTYRPSHNAYMVGNARAVSETAKLAGQNSVAANFTNLADALETAMYEHLWNPDQQFFVDVIRPDNPNLTQLQGREEVGLFPFRFGIGLEDKYCTSPSEELFDPQGFYTTYAPATLEVRNEYYSATKPNSYCCYWNGQSWPFSTAHVLKSLASMYRSNNCSLVAEKYYQYLSIYATTQHKDGAPYVAESHYPDIDEWSGDSFNHSEHYDHSTNNDDVITGLLGLVPRLDDVLQFSPIIPSNWTYFALENITLARPRNFSSVTLGIYSDVARGGAIDCPEAIEIYGSSNRLLARLDPFDTCVPNELNTISFNTTVESDFLSVTMYKKENLFVGICELQVWVPPDRTSGIYYAVDAVLTGAEVIFNSTGSRATPNGAVVGSFQVGSKVLFSGVYDAGISTKAKEIVVNAMDGDTVLSLPPTDGLFTTVSLQVDLLPGSNFVAVMMESGYDAVELEYLLVV